MLSNRQPDPLPQEWLCSDYRKKYPANQKGKVQQHLSPDINQGSLICSNIPPRNETFKHQNNFVLSILYPAPALAETEDGEDSGKQFFSSGKTNSIPSKCKPTRTGNGVASGITERISGKFCTSSTLHVSHWSFGQNEGKTFSNQFVTPNVLQRPGLTAARQLVANHKSTSVMDQLGQQVSS